MVIQKGFQELEALSGFYSYIKGNLRSVFFQLRDGRLCLVNPLKGTSQQAWESLKGYGEVAYILSPNHYHNKGVQEAAAQFPKACLCSSSEALPRLETITELKFIGLEKLINLLPEHITIEHSKGLKTGEVWLCVSQGDIRALVVADAFCGERLSKAQDKVGLPELLKTFPKYGVKDAGVYQVWAHDFIGHYNPNMLIPFHGGLAQSAKLPSQLDKIVQLSG